MPNKQYNFDIQDFGSQTLQKETERQKRSRSRFTLFKKKPKDLQLPVGRFNEVLSYWEEDRNNHVTVMSIDALKSKIYLQILFCSKIL